ncbi:hypothetical protein Acr_03g0010100 [Actinidia rufa]|uniref:Uncharacterized protein n=1 Tax=Actinidia rufa TaxID=165716 RepID=A0A7J0EDG3_9ERIC|nr:hypothetical protein Acr_03g0010100 [Actinidia rufa]
MGPQNSLFSIVILITMLALAHMTSSRHIDLPRNEVAEQRLRAKFYSTFLRYFSAIPKYEQAKNEETSPVYAVSRREVPGGPNPLHN